MADSDPHIELVRDGEPPRVLVLGRWDFLRSPEKWRQAQEELGTLNRPATMHWDLHALDALDSAGALVLWRAWGRKFPSSLDVSERYRGLFQRLQTLPEQRPRESWGAAPFRWLAALPLATWRESRELIIHFGMVLLAAGYALSHPRAIPWRELSAVVYRAGFQASGLVAMINLVVGMMAAYQIGLAVTRFTANTAAVGAFSTAVLREIGPWVTAIIVAGRSGAGIAAEISSMHLTGELSALRTFGVSPILRLALPRVVGLAILLPLLVVLGNAFAILGGSLIAEPTIGISTNQFIGRLPEDVRLVNFWIGELKALGNGIIIGTVSTYYGMRAAADTESLSRQTISSVVMSLSLVLVLNAGVGALYVEKGLPG